MKTWSLNRTKQCSKCPWKVSTNPHDIPDGYSEEKHKNLSCTIAKESNIFSPTLKIMACHAGNEDHCIGWLVNQLGPGNNIPMRIKMISCDNHKDIKTYGKQHEFFENTLPKKP